MASLHELRELPVQRDYFISFDDLLKIIRDASIKHKFSFKTPHKDPKRARYKCSHAAGRRKRDSGRARYGGLRER